jgi:integrase/recombinase XerD
MNKLAFVSIVQDYIAEKQAIGNIFIHETRGLKRIINLQQEVDQGRPVLSKELFKRWAEKTPWENTNNRTGRISLLRGLSDYMIRQQYDAVFIPKKFCPSAEYNYTPYIFSDRQLKGFLITLDQYCSTSEWIYFQLEFPIVFRLLIGCGLRISETLAIEKEDYDQDRKTILLKKTKNRRERIIPIADSLAARIDDYILKNERLRVFGDSPLLFPNPEGNQYSSGRCYHFFRRILWLTGIPHQGRGIKQTHPGFMPRSPTRIWRIRTVVSR